jgi:hypothetical protein
MRARPNLTGEQIVTDYLTRVAQAARLLPKGARMAFVGRTRALIDRELGPPGTRTDPEHVIEVLERLGKPEDLVVEERTRIDRSWVKSRATTREEGEAAAAALSGPRMNRPLTARRRPNSGTQPLAGKLIQPPPGGTVAGGSVTGPDGSATAADGSVTGPDGSVTGMPGAPRGPGPRRPVLRSTGQRDAGARTAGQQGAGARTTGTRAAGPPAGGPRRLRSTDSPGAAPGTGPHGVAQHGAEAPGGGPGNTGRTGPVDWLIGHVPGRSSSSGGPETFTASAGRLARDHMLESVAILFLGLGGLILPFPFWPIGAVVGMFSRLWDARDKLLAVIGPLLVTLVASVLTALFIGGTGNAILIYFHAIRVSFGLMVRVGSVLTAAYLAWRVSKGPRAKAPPWKHIVR